jgi:hypothetical protein
MKNWRTSLIGVLGGLPGVIQGLLEGDYPKAIQGVLFMVLGFVAKDYGVTGAGV